MKKQFLISALCVASQMALADASTVTVFGVIDTDVTVEKNGSQRVVYEGSSGSVFSRLGFRGNEDLGGGMAASFWLEMGLNTQNGTVLASNTNNQSTGSTATSGGALFSRRATVSLSGDFGEVRLGRDYTPTFWNTALFDPFGAGGGIGANHLYFDGLVNGFKPTGTRASNSIGYFLPSNLGGAYGQVMLASGGQASGAATAHDGDYEGWRFGYASGPFNVALSYGITQYASGDYKQGNLGGSYTFDASLSSLKLMTELYTDSIGAAVSGQTAQIGHGFLVGFKLPVGNSEFKGAYAQYHTNAAGDPSSARYSLGYIYNFSKRTSVYATVARVTNANGSKASLGGVTDPLAGATSGAQAGITHTF